MGYVRRSAIFVLRDKSGRILLQHRDKNIKRFPDYWGFFGGEIKKGEALEEAVKREAKEELEIELKDFKFFNKYELEGEDGLPEEEFVFTVPLTIPLEKLRKQQREGQDLDLFSFNKWKNLKTPEHEKVIFEDLFSTKF